MTLLVLGLAALSAGTAGAQPDTAAVDRYGACLAAQKTGDLLILVDESGSLQRTDPHAARVRAAQYLVTMLGRYADRTASDVDVAIAGFSTDYVLRQDWAPLTGASAGAVNDALAALASRDTGPDTDYWAALDGARQTLAARARGDPNRCQAIAWFTDGQIDFSQRPGSRPYAPAADLNSPAGIAETVRRATESICRDGGLADQLRSDRIVMLAIGLGNENFDVLSAIAAGHGVGGKACGHLTDPTPGAFFPVANIDELLFAFDALNPDPRITDAKPVCREAICEQARHNFVLDRSIKSVNILGSGGGPGIVPYLIDPAGRQLELTRHDGEVATDIDGMPVRYEWLSESAQTVALQSAGGAGWPGRWAIVYVDTSGQHPGAVSRVSIHISTDIFPALHQDPQAPWRAGQVVNNVTFGLVDGADHPVDPAGLAGQAVLSAALTAPGVTVPVLTAVPKTGIGQPVEVDLTGVPPGPATLRMSLVITTAPALGPQGVQVAPGTTLSPQRVELPLQILPKLGLPVPGQRIDFGTVQGVQGGVGALQITGPGCVWIDAAGDTTIVAAPEDIGTVRVTAAATGPGDCLQVPDGQTASLPVRLHTERDGHGGLNGTVPVHLASTDDPGQVGQVVDVTFTASLIKPLRTTNFVLALLAALLLGPGIPLALLYAGKWWAGTIPGEPLLAERIPVEVDAGVVLRDGEPFAMADTDLVTPVPGLATPARRLVVRGVTLSVVTGRSPFGTAHVQVRADGYVSAGSEIPATDATGVQAVLPLAVHGRWVLLHDPLGPPDRAEVLLMVHGRTDLDQRRRLYDDVSRRLPDLLTGLRRAAQADQPARPDRPVAAAPRARFDPFLDEPDEPAATPPPPEPPVGDPEGAAGAGSFDPPRGGA